MLSSTPLWKYRYTKSASSKQEAPSLSPVLTPDYVVEVHFCLSRRTGQPLWEGLFFEERGLFEVLGVYDDIIAAQRMDGPLGPHGLWCIDLWSGKPIISPYPNTFWGRMKHRRAQNHWWKIGNGYNVRGKINADGRLPTSAGLLDLKSLTLVQKKTYDIPAEEPSRIQQLFKRHRFDLSPLGVLHHHVDVAPEYVGSDPDDPSDWLDFSEEIEQLLWMENKYGDRLWEFNLAEETASNHPAKAVLHLATMYLFIVLFWPTKPDETDVFFWPGSNQIWVLDLRTGKIIQKLIPVEESFDGEIAFDDDGLLFFANVQISDQQCCELVYFPFSEQGEDTALGASGDR